MAVGKDRKHGFAFEVEVDGLSVWMDRGDLGDGTAIRAKIPVTERKRGLIEPRGEAIPSVFGNHAFFSFGFPMNQEAFLGLVGQTFCMELQVFSGKEAIAGKEGISERKDGLGIERIAADEPS